MQYTVLFVVVFAVCISAHRDDHHAHVKDKVGEYVKSTAWKSLGWDAKLNGSAVVSITHKFRVPLKTILMGKGYRYPRKHSPTCLKIKTFRKSAPDGEYTIYPDLQSEVQVYCDMTTEGGGWTVFQRRFDGSVDFYKGWKDYKRGFGKATGEYWLGNNVLHELTKQGLCTLRIDMVTTKDEKGFAEYSNFTIGSEQKGYVLNYNTYLGGVGDSLSYHKGMKFTTKDRDNDKHKKNCASWFHGAWWYNACLRSDLNGLYGGSGGEYMKWFPWNEKAEKMKQTKMMIKC